MAFAQRVRLHDEAMEISQWRLASLRASIDLSVSELLVSSHRDSEVIPLNLRRPQLHIGAQTRVTSLYGCLVETCTFKATANIEILQMPSGDTDNLHGSTLHNVHRK